MEATAATMRSAAHRCGGGVLLVGTIPWLLLRGLHGDLPGTRAPGGRAGAAPVLATDPLLTIVAAARRSAARRPLPRSSGRAGAAVLVPAGAVLGVGYAIDGFVLAAVAEAHAAASDAAERTMALMQADLVLKVIGGTSFAFQTLFGLAIAMIASAVVLFGEYPRGVLGGREGARPGCSPGSCSSQRLLGPDRG